MKTRVVGDVSSLPDHAFGLKSLLWWGLLGFMVIEAMAFILAGGAYLYIRGQNPAWPFPPDAPPALTAGIVTTVLFVISEVVNRWLAKMAKTMNEQIVRLGVTLMIGIGFAIVVSRIFELASMNTRWDVNAYGSVTWLLLFLHTLHLLTDWVDTAVLGSWLYTHKIEPTQFTEVYDNCGYWSFVFWSWLPMWGLIYFAPRLM
ncbi:MAG TPA: hypothetical protein VD906_03760 [Caulobacteraceae bacterium]|nr:hypothetical protein [Caulobacteraceae bacterium]